MPAFLSDYTLLDEIGHGAFASVYKVRHNTLGYIRAVRVLNETIAKGEQDPVWLKFLNECRILLRLGNGNNPHIVHIYQPLLRDNKALVEMDFVDGMDLHHYLESQNNFVECQEVERLAREMGGALAFCHHDIYRSCMSRDEDNLQDDPDDGSRVLIDDAKKAQLVKKYQVIHNDLHSGNIMRRNDGGGFVLLDFGLSIQDGDVLHTSKRRGGAPEYKAPEKWDNESTITCQSDIFSLGVILYEMLTGKVPFKFDTANPNQIEAEYRLMHAIKSQPVTPIYEARKRCFEAAHPGVVYTTDYPEWLEVLIMRCLEKDPAKRFADGHELHDFIEKYSKTATAESRHDAHLIAMKQQLAQRLQELNTSNRAGTVPPPRKPKPQPQQVMPPIPAQGMPVPPARQAVSPMGQQRRYLPATTAPARKKNSHSMLTGFIIFLVTVAIIAGIAYAIYSTTKPRDLSEATDGNNNMGETATEAVIETASKSQREAPVIEEATPPEPAPAAEPAATEEEKTDGTSLPDIIDGTIEKSKEVIEVVKEIKELL